MYVKCENIHLLLAFVFERLLPIVKLEIVLVIFSNDFDEDGALEGG